MQLFSNSFCFSEDSKLLAQLIDLHRHCFREETFGFTLSSLVKSQLQIRIKLNVVEQNTLKFSLIEPSSGSLVGGVKLPHSVQALRVDVLDIFLQVHAYRNIKLVNCGQCYSVDCSFCFFVISLLIFGDV